MFKEKHFAIGSSSIFRETGEKMPEFEFYSFAQAVFWQEIVNIFTLGRG